MTDHPTEPESDGDEIIATATRWSLWLVGTLAVIAGLIWFVTSRTLEQEIIEQAPQNAPQSTTELNNPSPPPVSFVDARESMGVEFSHDNGAYGERLLPETMGSGVAILDVNNDGYQDLFFVNSTDWSWREPKSPKSTQALYLNTGEDGFVDVTRSYGLDISVYGTGVATGDVNSDGWIDLFITTVGENLLLLNQQGEGFVRQEFADPKNQWSTSAAFFDFDNDGDLDLFFCNYVKWDRQIDLDVDYRLAGIGRAYGPPANYQGTFSELWLNDGTGKFEDNSSRVGLQVRNSTTNVPVGKALAVVPYDIDRDGWVDLVVANDTVRNFLFRNINGEAFEEIGVEAGIAFDNSGNATGAMGVDISRHAANRSLAVAIGNFSNEMTSFYVSPERAMLFSDEAVISGIGPASRVALSFGLFFFDYDLDGVMDLFQTNGHVENEINTVQPSQRYAQPSQLFWGCESGCARSFVALSEQDLGDLALPVVGRGAAFGDLDQDGDLDVVVTQVSGAPLILRNEQALGHNFVRVLLRSRSNNTFAYGARVMLTGDGWQQEQYVMPARSYLSQTELPVTFGLGGDKQPKTLHIRWPDGSEQIRKDFELNALTTIWQEE